MSKLDKLRDNILEYAEITCLILAAVFFLLWLMLTTIGLIINL